MKNPQTTWAGVVSLAITACLVGFLIYTDKIPPDIALLLLGGNGASVVNAVGNLLSKDAKQ